MPVSGETADGNGTIIVGSGHQLSKVRAGQQASFECNAAGGGHSKALRVRWYRLLAHTGGQTAPIISTGVHNKDHYYKQSLVTPARNQQTMDEAQIKTSLLQMGTIQALSESFKRLEFVNSNWGEWFASDGNLNFCCLVDAIQEGNLQLILPQLNSN